MTTLKPEHHTPPRRRLRLTSVDGVRSYLAGCLQRLEDGMLSESATKTRAYVAQTLVRILEASDLENRIKALEEKEKYNE